MTWVKYKMLLFCSADGDYHISIESKVEIRFDGHVAWEAPAIYKSFCAIDVRYFPYDSQHCEMKFGPWSEDISRVDYFMVDPMQRNQTMTDLEVAADLRDYHESAQWDLLKITANRSIWKYPCCDEGYVDIKYNFHMVIPCIALAMLTVIIFYLPSESREKVVFVCVDLVDLTVFILLLFDILPPTSLAVSIIGKYVVFTTFLNFISIICNVFVVYIAT